MTNSAANHNAEAPAVTIFIDLDGVLADFDTHARAHGKIKADGKTDYDALDVEWWRTMPAFDGAVDFLQELKKEGQTKYLTAPMVSPDSHYGKAQWITNFEPGRGKWALMDLIICPGKDKQYLAAADRILVDDRIANVKQWEEAGGVGGPSDPGQLGGTGVGLPRLHVHGGFGLDRQLHADGQTSFGNDRPHHLTLCQVSTAGGCTMPGRLPVASPDTGPGPAGPLGRGGARPLRWPAPDHRRGWVRYSCGVVHADLTPAKRHHPRRSAIRGWWRKRNGGCVLHDIRRREVLW